MSDEIVNVNETSEAKMAGAMEIVKRNMIWSAGAGLLPIPWIELVAITSIEVKLIKDLSDYYSMTFRKDLAKTAVASLIGSLGSLTLGKILAGSSLRLIPVIGHLVAAASLSAVAASITYAIGKVFISHFETGGTLLDFDPVKVREYFRTEFTKDVNTTGNAASEKVVPENGGKKPVPA